MIAAQTDVCAGLRLLSLISNWITPRLAARDRCVTEKTSAGWSPGRVGLTRPEQALQHVEAAVNIAEVKVRGDMQCGPMAPARVADGAKCLAGKKDRGAARKPEGREGPAGGIFAQSLVCSVGAPENAPARRR